MCSPSSFNETISNYSNICNYILSSGDCELDSGFINYYAWQYCSFDNHAAPTVLMLLWLIVLLLTIGVTADTFFAPCLVVVTRILRMSQNLAGVTLLALGNGAADVFSSLSAVISGDKPNVGLAFGSLIGAGILVNTVTAGVIMIIRPFPVNRRPLIKDLVFYLIAQILCMMVLIMKQVHLWSAALFLTVYIIYVFVTGIGRLVYVKYFRKTPKTDEDNKVEDTERDDPETTIKYNPPSIRFGSKSSSSNIDRIPSIQLVNVTHLSNQSGYLNTSFVTDPNDPIGGTGGGLSTSRFRNIPNVNETNFLSLTVPKSAVKRAPSTSHRRTGFLAQLIMANEVRRDLMKNYSEFEIRQVNRDRTKSVVVHEVNDPPERVRFMSVVTPRPSSHLSIKSGSEVKDPKKGETMDDISLSSDKGLSRISTDSNLNRPMDRMSSKESEVVDEFYMDFPGVFWHFIYTIIPVDLDSWSEQSVSEKVMTVVQAPMVFVLTLTIPIVDESSLLQGWCKIMNSLHCFISPIIWFTLLKFYNYQIRSSQFLIIYLVLIIGMMLCITVFLTSKPDKPPIYHSLFAFIGFITSIVWIYAVANEIVNILAVFGIVFGIPDTILGLSVLAVANSIGDLVSNIMLARRNFPRIAYAACIGGPLFNLLIGFGLPFSIKAAEGPINFDVPLSTIILLVTIMFITIMNLIVLPVSKFYLKPPYGIILIIIYVVFFIVVITVTAVHGDSPI